MSAERGLGRHAAAITGLAGFSPEYVENLRRNTLAKISPEPMSGCWLWTGALNNDGYGVQGVHRGQGQYRVRAAHRVVYLFLVGDLPPNIGLDHTCSLRCCVNPAHLQPVTHAENNARSYARGFRKVAAPKERKKRDPLTTLSHLTSEFREVLHRRILAKTKRDDRTGCLVWTGALNCRGYSSIAVGYAGPGKPIVRAAHRVLYLLERGDIPAGLDLDHICHNPVCVEPAHMEPVTRRINCQRGDAAKPETRRAASPLRNATPVHVRQVSP